MLIVRTMQSSDLASVYNIELIAHRAPWSRGIIRDCLLVGYDCQVLVQDNKVIGYIICRHSANVCHILNLCIAPTAQGQGYGKFLLKSYLDSLKYSVIDTIFLEVRPTNKIAIALYQAFGFQCDTVKKDYYQDKESCEDAFLLKKMISRAG